MKLFGPNPNNIHPNENIRRICFIKNAVKNPRIIAVLPYSTIEC